MTDNRLFYLDDYCDEVVPCDCKLESWAAWLSKPDEDWGREAPAADGETFKGHTLDVLGDVRVEHRDGAWQAVEAIPEGTEFFFLRHYQGGTGWNAEFAAGTIEDATDCLEAEESPVWFACTRDGPKITATFHAESPRLTWELQQ